MTALYKLIIFLVFFGSEALQAAISNTGRPLAISVEFFEEDMTRLNIEKATTDAIRTIVISTTSSNYPFINSKSDTKCLIGY